MKHYGYDTGASHSAIIYELGTKAHEEALYAEMGEMNAEGMIVGSSEWGWLTEENGRRICAALECFHGVPTEEIERLAREKTE